MTHIRYLTLDGLRGIAALCVAFLHMPHFFHYTPPNAYLAVDFFFMLSGFVLAFAYDDRIAGGMSFREFFAIRFTRLYPTYLVGFALGILVALASLKFPGSALSVTWTPKLLVCAVGSGIMMLPTPPCDGNDWLYPLNPPMWSILFEVIIGVLFFLTHRMLRRPSALIGVILFGSVATACLYLYVGDANLGFSWSQFWVGLLRVTISFSIGTALFRFWPVRAQTSSAPVTVGLSILCATLLLQPIDGYFYALLMIFVFFPLLIAVGSRFTPAGIHTSAFAASGAISYIIYAIHKPTYQLFYGALIKFLPGASPLSITMIGVVFFIALAFGCLAMERILERPARTMLTRLWRSRLVTAISPAPARV